jgi:hypothetical protein
MEEADQDTGNYQAPYYEEVDETLQNLDDFSDDEEFNPFESENFHPQQ